MPSVGIDVSCDSLHAPCRTCSTPWWPLSRSTSGAVIWTVRDNGYVWLSCTCGVQIVQPASPPPPSLPLTALPVRSLVFSVALLLLALPASGDPRSFKCKEPLPEFTLGATSNPSDAEVEKLCACIWSKLPADGWERRVSAQIRRGEDPGWRGRGFVPRFGAAIDACGGRSL